MKLKFLFALLFVWADSSLLSAQSRLYSEVVKDSFTIFIQLPKGYATNTQEKFAVTYLLDANYYFKHVAKQMSKKSPTILVGVGYKSLEEMDSLRDRDYTYPVALAEDSFATSGGADKFLGFLEKELIPYIDANYRTDKSNRTIMGHSLGGYFVLFALQEGLKHKSVLFNRYVAASPSLHYYHQYLLKQFQNITESDTTNRTLLVTLGAKEDTEEEETGTVNTDNFNFLTKELATEKFAHLKTQSIIFPRYGHMATAIPTFAKSLEEIP